MKNPYLSQRVNRKCKMVPFFFLCLLLNTGNTDAVTLTGSSEYAVPGSEFTLTCDVPEEANAVLLYRRPDVTAILGSIQVAGGQCYNTIPTTPVLCSPDVCSCTTTSTNYGTVFQWVIQPQTGGHGSVWYCRRTNPSLPVNDSVVDSPDYTLNVANGPGTVSLSPPDTTYTRTDGDTLPDITCTADCRPGCTFVWTKPDNTNFTASAVLSLGQLDRSEHGTYRCTARNGVGESTTTTSVTVQYGPGTVTLFPSDTTFTRNEGDTLPDITCIADCRPDCTFVWTKPDNTNLTASAVLSLGQLNRSEHGTYRCTARNVVRTSTTTTKVMILFPPRIVSLSYTQGGADVTENGSKSLICSVESYPPSTIQWYYKANNTLLLTTPDVLESTYTLTTAGCLDTGVYTCSVSNTKVTRDIDINILCQPRQDHRVVPNCSFGLAITETLTIPANFLSNPKPSFSWTFQTSPGSPATTLANGSENFAIYNTFEMQNLSALSVGTRSTIKEDWFGVYNVTATNSQGSGTISFSAVAKGKPDPPKDGKVSCLYRDHAILSWRPAFNGGSTQTFAVGIKIRQDDGFIIDKSLNRLDDPGPGQIINVTVSNLASGTQHFFMVYARNDNGNSTFEEEINCTTKAEPAPESYPLGPIIGGVLGSLVAIIIVIVFIIKAKRRKLGRKGKDDDTEMITSKKRSAVDDSTDGMKPNILYESSDGLKINVLYESSGPLPGSSSEYAIVQKPSKTKSVSPNALYAEVDQTKNGKSDVCAEVVKPKTKVGKGKGEKKKVKVGKEENVAGTEDGVYANCKDDPKLDSDIGPANKKNQDGLVYLDIKFKEDQQSGRNYVVHGIENRTDYSDIDFTNHVDPSPQKGEEVQPKEDNKNN